MSEYKYLDKDGLIYYHSKVKTLLGGKVDKETGKGLSTNDYTTDDMNKLAGIEPGAQVNQYAFSKVEIERRNIEANRESSSLYIEAGDNVVLNVLKNNGLNYGFTISATDTTYDEATTSAAGLMSSDDKTKLNGISAGAQVNTIESIYVNNAKVTPSSQKAVYLSVPSVDSALVATSTNPVQNKVIVTALDAKAPLASPTFTGTPKAPTAAEGTNTTQIATTAFVTTAVATAIGSITGIKFEIVQTLPTTGENGTIYMVSHGGTGTNIYDEYVYVNNAWEKIGSTDIDLSNYVQKTDMVSITNAEIDTIVS